MSLNRGAPVGRSSLVRLAVLAYAFPTVMAIGAITPGANFALYTGHGGPGWIILPLAFPTTLGVLIFGYFQAGADEKRRVTRFMAASLLVYLPVSYAASYAGVLSIQRSIGLEVEPHQLWGFFLFPFSLIAYLW